MASLTRIRRSNFVMKRPFLTLIVCSLIAVPCLAQSQVTSITVKSTWDGMGQPRSSELVIKQKKGHYYADSNRVPDLMIQSFMTAIENAAKQGSELERLGLNSEWLKNNAGAALRNHLQNWEYKAMSPEQKELFVNSFSNIELMNAALSKQEGLVTLDDFPEINVQIRKENSVEYSLKLTASPDFLHEWSVTNLAGNFETSDVAISLALGELLPPKFTNRERLTEHALLYMTAYAAMQEVKDKWDSLGATARLGPAIEAVTNRFTLVSSAISSLSSIDLEGGEAWNAVVRNSALPSNVTISFSLPIRKKKLIGVDSFLQRIDGYAQLVLSPAWFHEFLIAHPDAKVEIRFVEDRSLSRHAAHKLFEDLTSMGKGKEARRASASAMDEVFLELESEHSSRWLVFPNGEMMLWEYQGGAVGNWSDKDFQHSNCYGWKCVGAIISANGEIIK